MILHPDFPFTVPWLYFGHKRFIGTPHVQWGSYICLYQSTETEWSPADGLFGFFDRVDAWFAAAGSGQLDPDDAPLHPPVAYAKSSTTFVIHANAPEISDAASYWLGRADLEKVRDSRLDVTGWTHLNDWPDTEAGASAITIVDNGIVGPGLLARQRYRTIDIGLAKASVLKERLVDIGFAGGLVSGRIAIGAYHFLG